MTITQYIIDYIIDQMETRIGNDVTGDGIAIMDIKKQVVSLRVSASGEREYLGLDDTKGTYFYFRLNGNADETRVVNSGAKFGSCGTEILARIPFKLVGQHRCQDPCAWLETLKSALYLVNFHRFKSPYDITEIKLFPVAANPVPWKVYESETGQDPVKLTALDSIVSNDFILQYQYTYSDKCTDFLTC